MWKKDGDDINNQAKELIEKVNLNEIQGETINKDNIDKIKDVEIIKSEDKIEDDNPYWAYINMNLINVDFQDLKEVNKDAAGWIQVKGTNINYPYVQTTNNEFYLTHAFDKSYNSAGWVFLDYRNKQDLSDKNNIIYAHGRYDKTMFGTLRNALTNGWLNDKNNYVIKIATPTGSSLWQVFSIYHIPATSDYLQINFTGNDQFLKFVNKLIKRSAYNFNTKVNENDTILTLSTCYNSEERVVLHAKLIKRK
jgi:sortase B